MSLRDVMAFIQKRQCASHAGAADTPDTPVKPVGYHLKPAWTGACTPDTPDTPVFSEVGADAQKGQPGEASSDANASQPEPAPEPVDWCALDKAYLAHHAHCPTCIAAGRGARYGMRCGVGAAMWTAYNHAASQPGAMPWEQKGQP